jgi:hypothetical protein
MKKQKKIEKTPNNSLDMVFGKRPRGRPKTIDPSLVRGTADRNRVWFKANWSLVSVLLLAAQSEQEVESAVRCGNSTPEEFFQLAHVILAVLKDSRFPKRKKSQIHFLADSIAGGNVVTPRRSRDICAQERNADASRFFIKRYEYWIECSCGYEGHSLNHGCKKCGATLYLPDFNSGTM